MQLDELDTRILRALVEDARRSLRDVAALVGASPTTVSSRLERLADLGLVQGASLRLAPHLLPGRGRLVTGRVRPADADAVLQAAATATGLVEAAVTGDGRLTAFLHVRDLDEEERILAALAAAGAEELAVVAGRRTTGPPLAHLFGGAVVVEEVCATCRRSVGAEPVTERVDERRVVFCCTSCRRLYMERYAALRDAADAGRHSTTS